MLARPWHQSTNNTSTQALVLRHCNPHAVPAQGKLPEGAPSVVIRAERNIITFGAGVLEVAERSASPDWIPPYREDKGVLGADGLALRSGIESGPEGEARRDSVDRDEKRLGELGRKTVEMLAIAHIFCEKLEVRRGAGVVEELGAVGGASCDSDSGLGSSSIWGTWYLGQLEESLVALGCLQFWGA